ncbi:MAG TPA: vanadium-dependent haloperoxidase [Methylocella sp.]|nr:vanadium-dependent haloperoxidase [Methylocella sp.]
MKKKEIYYSSFLFTWAFVSLIGLASAAAAESPLSETNLAELQRLLSVPANQTAVSMFDTKLPRVPASTFDRCMMWNEIALDITAIDHTPGPAFGEQLGPTRASYAMAIAHIAMFEAVNAVTKKYASYAGVPFVSGDVSVDFAVAQAMHDGFVGLYPLQKLDALFEADVANITGSHAGLQAGAALGRQAAEAILSKRQNDGSQLPEPQVQATCSLNDNACFPANPNVPGKWQIDPVSKLTVALGANWPKVKPFVLKSADQFRLEPPPSLTSDAYKRAYRQVYRLGGDPAHGTGTGRTAQQTFIGGFWSYDGTPNLCAPPRLYNQIARTVALQQKMLTPVEMTRFLALINVAMTDAAIVAWDSKYYYEFWRPVTGIRNAAYDTGVDPDPSWYPLGALDTNTSGPNFTPPFPSYPSGHATIGGALFQIMRHFWPDNTPFTFVSDEYNGHNKDIYGNIMPLHPMTFHSFREAEYDNQESRIYLGVHWQFDEGRGTAAGNSVGDYVFEHAFRPLRQGEGE